MKRFIAIALALLISIGADATTLNPIQLLNPAGSSSGQAVVSTGASSAPAWGGVGLNGIAAIAANTVLSNATGSSAAPTAFAMPSCTGAANALGYTSGTGIVCNSAINAAQLGGTAAASYALLASPPLTGIPTAPTATLGTNTTQIATTAFVQTATGSGRLLNVQVFTSTATYTPTAGTNSVIVVAIAGGGGGGGTAATAASQFSVGAGGGSGAFAISRITSGFSGVTVTIGAGGAGNSGGAGSAGGVTSFGALVSCPGGTGGATVGASTNTTPVGALGTPAATATGGSIVNSGGTPGANSIATGSAILGGAGASGPFGSAGAPAFQATGGAALGFGAGGGGVGSAASQSAFTGGAGIHGGVIVYEYQ